MPLITTTIGAFPKPPGLPISDWFAAETTAGPDATLAVNELGDRRTSAAVTASLDAATADAVRDQVDCGVDVPTDGEIRRENYLHYHCRHLHGIDFDRLTRRSLRNGSWVGDVPTFVGPISARSHFLHRDHAVAQQATDRPVKITVPGPITLMDSTADAHYGSERTWGEALAAALNSEIRHLAEAGCSQIQIDEPAFARTPELAADLGFRLLAICLDGVQDTVTVTLHMCCGYPDRLDNEDYPKADRHAYAALAAGVDASRVDVVSLEDAHRHNDLDDLRRFERVSVALGAVAIARSRVEDVEAVARRLTAVAEVTGTDRLLAAPDCGLGLLDRPTALAKLRVLTRAAATVG